MIPFIVIICCALYLVGLFTTGFYLSDLGIERKWLGSNTEAAVIFGSVLWPFAWLIMFAWWLSTKIGVPKR